MIRSYCTSLFHVFRYSTVLYKLCFYAMYRPSRNKCTWNAQCSMGWIISTNSENLAAVRSPSRSFRRTDYGLRPKLHHADGYPVKTRTRAPWDALRLRARIVKVQTEKKERKRNGNPGNNTYCNIGIYVTINISMFVPQMCFCFLNSLLLLLLLLVMTVKCSFVLKESNAILILKTWRCNKKIYRKIYL